ncbi:hypothetical protein [Paenibacillus xylaniclasticus]|nr:MULTISPECIES: hypothetical protein [Paenibacillus]GFN32470.1 hypothetical protein PCURB6_27300 [Paenibacillus curdlanolyticus]
MELNLNVLAQHIHSKLPHLELTDIEEVLAIETDYMIENELTTRLIENL